MDLADKLGALSLKNAPIPEKGAGFKTKKLKTKEFEIPRNFKYPFGVQTKKFAKLVDDLISLDNQEASSSQLKRLNKAVGNLNEILDTSANFERQQLDSLKRSISYLDCYLKENSSKNRTSLKKKVIPQTNKMLKSIESRVESYRKSLIAKSSQNNAKKREKGEKEPVFLKMTNTPIVTFGKIRTLLPPPLFRLFKNRSFATINSLS